MAAEQKNEHPGEFQLGSLAGDGVVVTGRGSPYDQGKDHTTFFLAAPSEQDQATLVELDRLLAVRAESEGLVAQPIIKRFDDVNACPIVAVKVTKNPKKFSAFAGATATTLEHVGLSHSLLLKVTPFVYRRAGVLGCTLYGNVCHLKAVVDTVYSDTSYDTSKAPAAPVKWD
jgi:hypothetical protein